MTHICVFITHKEDYFQRYKTLQHYQCFKKITNKMSLVDYSLFSWVVVIHSFIHFLKQLQWCTEQWMQNLSTPNRPKKYINIGTSKENCTKQIQQSGITKHVDKTSWSPHMWTSAGGLQQRSYAIPEADCTGKMNSWWWASWKLETCRE